MEIKRQDVQQLLAIKEESEEQECSSSLNQEEQKPQFIKEDADEFIQIPVDVKSEYHETRNILTQQVKPEVSCCDTHLHPDHQSSPSSEADTDNSEDWRDTRNTQSGLNYVENLKDHVKEGINDDDGGLNSMICSGCGIKSAPESGPSQHIISCCFAQRDSLKKNVKHFSCSQCGNSFTQHDSLKKHMRIHTGEKPFSCSQCGKRFTQGGGLKRHMRTHTGEKSYPCSLCEKSYPWKEDLKNHMRSHTGEKPFSCALCGHSFTHRNSLKDHMRIHTGEKPFSCSLCGNCFTHRKSLKDHMRIHTGEKPFSCSHCHKAFKHRVSLKRHMKAHC